MSLVSMTARSVRPQPEASILGVGRGSGSTLTDLFKMGTSGSHMVDLRGRSDAASGSDARCLYARLHQYGTGGGEAVRAYAFANNAAAATGGTLNGLHASLSIATSSGISGAGNAIRATLEAASASRTLGGTLSVMQLDSNIGASNTLPAGAAFLRVTDTGSVKIGKLLNLPTVASGGLLAAHVTDGMTHSIRCIDAAGTVFYLMATTTSSNRTGGA